MGIFSRKNKKKDYKTRIMHDEGLPNFAHNQVINIYLDDDNNRFVISECFAKTPKELYIDYDKITNAEVLSEKEIIEKNKTVLGRATVGTLLLGPLGGIVGGISGVGTKQKKKVSYYFIINYKSTIDDEIKIIRLKVMDIIPGIAKQLKDRIKVDTECQQYL